MKYELPKLNYSYEALEPYLDAQTMQIHYEKHHQAYVDKFNVVLEKYPELAKYSLENIFRQLAKLPLEENDRLAIKNFGGGYINHNLFWQIMSPNKAIDDNLVKEIEKNFGSVGEFKNQFSELAARHFGSGWAWLVYDQNKDLKIYSLPNQDNPLSQGHEPIITLDLWEHAYYLKYKNNRAEYIKSWWNVLKVI